MTLRKGQVGIGGVERGGKKVSGESRIIKIYVIVQEIA